MTRDGWLLIFWIVLAAGCMSSSDDGSLFVGANATNVTITVTPEGTACAAGMCYPDGTHVSVGYTYTGMICMLPLSCTVTPASAGSCGEITIEGAVTASIGCAEGVR